MITPWDSHFNEVFVEERIVNIINYGIFRQGFRGNAIKRVPFQDWH